MSWLFSAPAQQLYSEHGPEECVRRLDAAITKEVFGIHNPLGAQPVIGSVTADRIRLRKRMWYSNSFQTVLSGTMQPKGIGTRLDVTLGVHPFVTYFMVLFFVLSIGIGGGLVIQTLGQLHSGEPLGAEKLVLALGVPVLMPVFALLLYRFGRWLARDEDHFLAGFLMKTIDARAI